MSEKISVEDWGLTEAQLSTLDNLADVRVNLKYPGYDTLLAYSPVERLERIRAELRREYAVLKKQLRGLPWERFGTHMRPGGVQVQLPLNRLPALLALPEVGSIVISAIENHQRLEEPDRPTFWAVEARFAVQIENETGGRQMFEDRMMVVKALDEEDARRKLLLEFARYAEPCLGGGGRLVRFQFEKFLRADWLNFASLDAAAEEGFEVFSTLKHRQLRPGMEWLGPEPTQTD